MKKPWLKALYLLLGIALVAFILTRIDLARMAAILKHASLPLLFLMYATALFQYVLSSIIWGRLLAQQGVQAPLGFLVKTYLIGNFIARAMPTKYAGDLYRTYASTELAGGGYKAAAAILLERISGIFVLLSMGFIASLFAFETLGSAALSTTVLVIFLGLLMGTGLLFTNAAYEAVLRVVGWARLHFLKKPMEKFHEAIRQYQGHRWFLVRTNLLSFTFKLVAFLCVYIGARSLGLHISFLSLMVIMPLIYVLEALPISIDGFGVREGAFVFLFSKSGLSMEEAFALSLVVLSGRYFCALAGGSVFLWSRIFDKKPGPRMASVEAK